MSRTTKRMRARGDRWLVLSRENARRIAFEEGVRLCSASASFRQAMIDDTAENWKHMAVLAKPEKERVRADVRAFALAGPEAAEAAVEKVKGSSLKDRFYAAFQDVLGA